jgi:kynurenine formamidase
LARRVVDLTQPLSNASQLHPFFPTVQILRQMRHADAAPDKKSFDAEIIITSNHAATHVDALAHFDPSPDAPKIAEMPLETFFGEAVCIDVREYPKGHEVTVAEMERAIAASGQEVRQGDILLFCTDHWNRTQGTPAFLDGFSGVAAECVHWMADRGVKIFGVETISPDLVYQTDAYTTHRACAERGLTHYENLNNLKEVVNRRFMFYGFPLLLEPAAGSPIRAVGVVED